MRFLYRLILVGFSQKKGKRMDKGGTKSVVNTKYLLCGYSLEIAILWTLLLLYCNICSIPLYADSSIKKRFLKKNLVVCLFPGVIRGYFHVPFNTWVGFKQAVNSVRHSLPPLWASFVLMSCQAIPSHWIGKMEQVYESLQIYHQYSATHWSSEQRAVPSSDLLMLADQSKHEK